MIEEKDYIYDNPSEYDILRKDYVEWEGKQRFPWKKIKVRNQNAYKDTVSGCGIYGLTAIYNWNQLNEFADKGIEFEQEDPRWKRYTFQAERWNPWNVGSSLQDCMSFFRKHWLIDWYLKCTTVEECKNAIKNGCGIYTWSNKVSWKESSKNKELTQGSGWAHCVALVDYDDTWFIMINSFGTNWWDNWFCHVNYDKFNLLFTTYAIVDHDDSGKLSELIYKAEFNKAIELGITNWTRPDEPATRREVSVQIYRLYKTIKQ